MRARKFTDQVEAEIEAAYRAGRSLSQIAVDYKCRVKPVWTALHRRGVDMRPAGGTPGVGGKRNFTADQEAEIVAAYRAGESLSAIAAERGCVLQTVANILKRNGIERRPRGNALREFSPKEVDEMGRRWNAGESQHAIATSLGLSQVQVSRVLRRAGIPLERRWAGGADHSRWKGGRINLAGGYVAVHVAPDDPMACMAHQTGHVLEHRLVMARKLGRPLTRTETVHHINGDRSDNSEDNLQLRQGRHGNGVVLTCADCGSHNIIGAPLGG